MKKGMQNSMSKKYRKLMPKACQNYAKMEIKIHEENEVMFLKSFWYAFGRQQGGPWHLCWTHFGDHFRRKSEKRHQKGMQKSMSKKYRKLVAKGSQNDTKMDTKIDENSYFSEKGWNARNYLFYNRKRGSGHLKSHEKSI